MRARCSLRSSTSKASLRYLMSARLRATDSGMSFIGGFEALREAMAAASSAVAVGALNEDERGGGRMTIAGREVEAADFLAAEADFLG